MTETTPLSPPPRRTPSTRARWAVPAVVAVGVGAAFAGPALMASADSDGLPPVTAEELVAAVASAEPQALSGTVVHTARLGLPSLPFGPETADPVNLLDGSSTLRVWTDGGERSRVSLLGDMSEFSVVHDGPEAWTYDSTADEVVHYTLSGADQDRYTALEGAAAAGQVPGAPELPTPAEAAQQVLDQVEQFSTVSLDAESTVAGRSAYQLVVTPTTPGTLVSRVVVAIDAKTDTPLRVQVWSVQDAKTPALELGFTDVTFGTPSDSVLAFSAPAGATVTDKEVALPTDEQIAADRAAHTEASAALPPGVTVSGTGWATVVEASDLDVPGLVAGDPSALAGLPDAGPTIGSESAQGLLDEFGPQDGEGPASKFDGLDPAALYDSLTTVVPEGHLISSALLSVLITDDGRVLVGAVPAATLQAMA
ncbi:LolA family protein [Cellulomonas sp. URHB0016]